MHRQLARLNEADEKYSAAVHHYRRVSELQLRMFGEGRADIILPLFKLGEMHWELGEYGQA